MIEEHRDPDLDAVRREWRAPEPGSDLHSRTLDAFDRQFRWAHRRWLWPLAVGLAAASLLIGVMVLRPKDATRYEPVQQPHFMIVSAGEHP